MSARAYTSSASQVNTAELCLRKWAWMKLDGLPDTQSQWAKFGTVVHKISERWLIDRIVPPASHEGNVARVIIQRYPARV